MLRTTFSQIRVTLPANAAYDVSASTTFGKINSELPIAATGQIGSDSLTGKIGAGGCELRLTNNNGSIGILKSLR